MLGSTRTAILIAALVSAVATSSAHAGDGDGDDGAPQWTLQTDPLTATLGIAQVLVERRVSDHLALYIGPSLRLYDSPLTADDEEGYRAYGTEQGARYFFEGRAPLGWWAGVRLIVAQLRYEGEERVGGYLSGLAGYAWVLGRRWILSGALGVSYFDYQVGGVGVDGVLPAAHTGIGVVF
jgi:hypothetical protein